MTAAVPEGVTVTYYDSYSHAQNGTEPLDKDSYLSTTANVWARVANGDCYGIDIVELVVYTPGTINLEATDVTCNGDTDGKLTINMQGAPYPFSIVWIEGGLTNVDIPDSYTYQWPGLSAGVYTAVITDGNGCNVTRTATINEPPALVASVNPATITHVSCFGGSDGTATVSASGGTAPYLYLWSNGSTDKTATGLAKGTYTVLVMDANGCTTTVEGVVINEPATPVQVMIDKLTDPSCEGDVDGSLRATATGGSGGYTYLWSNGQTLAEIGGLSAGTYSVIVKDSKGCEATATMVLTDPNGLSASVSGFTDVTCYGGSDGTATIAVSGGTATYTYQWSPSASNQTTASALNLPAGQHTVEVTDANGCKVQVLVTISEPTEVIATTVVVSEVLCKDGNTGKARVIASGGTAPYGYLWSDGQTTEVATGLAAGTYTVVVTDAKGCESSAASVVIREPAEALTANVEKVTEISCKGGSDGQIAVTVSGGTAPYSYDWNNGAPDVEDPAGLTAGTYALTITDANGCIFYLMGVVVSEPAEQLAAYISAKTDANCLGDATGSATVTASGGAQPYTFVWSNGNTQTGGTTSTAEELSAGGYLVTVTDANGCTVQTAVTIGDPSNLVLTVTGISDVLCYGSATGSASVSVSGGTASYTFSWSSGTATNLSNSSTANGLAAGIHTVEVTDGNGCRAVTTVVIGQQARLTVMITGSQDITCEGETDGTATVVATGGTGSYGYLWSNGEITATATGLPEGRADVTVTDANGCTTTASVWIDEPQPMAVNASVVQQVSCAGGSDGVAKAVAIGGTAPYTYAWSNGSTNALATGLTKGIYSVTITDARGCEATAEVTLTEPDTVACDGGSRERCEL